jgi:oligopeptide transport system permease protein
MGAENMLFFVKTAVFGVLKNKIAFAGAVIFFIIVMMAIAAPAFSPYNYYSHDADSIFLKPVSEGHWFGTDEFGRDLFVRVWMGARISLAIGILAAIIQMVIGTLYGGMAGLFGGLADEAMMRLADALYSIPDLILIVLVTLMMGNSGFSVVLALSLTGWTSTARVVRGQTLMLKEMDFVKAAKVFGAGRWYIMFKHILPNCSGQILASLMLNVPSAIFAESTLSFLGLGIKPPEASWGTLVNEGFKYSNITYHPWVIFLPLFFIAITMISLNILGDEFKKALDSKH